MSMNKNHDVFNLERFTASTCNDTPLRGKRGGLSIVSSNVSNRIGLSKAIQKSLPNLDAVQIGYADEFLAISNHLGEEHTDYTLCNSGNNKVIYNTALVNEIIDQFSLCYSDRTSRTFPIAHVENNVVYIQMIESNNEELLREDEKVSNDTIN